MEPALPRGQPVALEEVLVLWSLGLEQQLQGAVRIIGDRGAVVDARRAGHVFYCHGEDGNENQEYMGF